jgi:outer membrane lipase/esterase
MTITIRRLLPALLALGALLSTPSPAATYRETFFFGDSLSDTGSNAYLVDRLLGPFTSRSLRTELPIPSPTYVAGYPYASGRYSNGPVWAEYFAAALGTGAQSFFSGGTNYAFGGAHMGPLGYGLPPSVRDQVAYYLQVNNGRARADAWYSIEAGGNDARRAAGIALSGDDPSGVISGYVSDAITSVLQLHAAGARHILFWGVPDVGKTPEFLALEARASIATDIAIRMNSAIVTAAQGLPESVLRDVRGFDVFGVMNEVIAFPGRFGLTDVTTACAYTPSCIADPSTSLFWDGLHPTTRGHEILASAVLTSPTPEPGVVVLLGVGIAVMAIRLRPWRSRRSVRRLGA